MKLTATMMLTLDGVYQGPGAPDEDRGGGFDRGGWTAAYGDEEGWRFLTSWFERADAFLLGRKTWEIWEPYWPNHDSGVDDLVAGVPGKKPITSSRPIVIQPREKTRTTASWMPIMPSSSQEPSSRC